MKVILFALAALYVFKRFLLYVFLTVAVMYISIAKPKDIILYLAYAFRHKHPISVFYSGETQILAAETAAACYLHDFPEASLSVSDVSAYLSEFVNGKPFFVRCFWNLK